MTHIITYSITLISGFAKLFSLILNKRLQKWVEENDISVAQFGFKSNFSTIDAIVNSIIEKQLKINPF